MSAEIIHGDCLDAVRGIDAATVHAVVTDPPYGVRLNTKYRSSQRGVRAGCNDYPAIHGDDRPFDPTPWLAFPVVVLFGANYFSDRLPVRGSWYIWDKRDGMTSNDQADCELAWVGGVSGTVPRLFHHRWNGMLKASERDQRRVHPTQKPVELMRWVIRNLRLAPNSLILDPYCGSGSTGVAAMIEGHRFVGIEYELAYVEIARRRLNDVQPTLEPAA